MLTCGWVQKNRRNLLLEQDGAETSVESTDPLVLQHLAEATDETVGICGLRHETDTSGLKWAKGDISEELSKSCGSQVDGCPVVGGGLIAKEADRLLLEQFITSKLECALEEVSSSCWAETRQESTCTLICDDLSEATYETSVVRNGIELDSCLYAAMKSIVSQKSSSCFGRVTRLGGAGLLDLHIDRCETSVCH